MADEDLTIRLRALGAQGTARDANRVARAIDNVGDQAAQAARKLTAMNAAQSRTRVNIGPFSTSMRFAAVAVGGFILAAEKAVPFTLALAEGIGTAGAAAGGAGVAGFLAFKQASVVAKLGASDLTAALGGNKQAFKNLTPEARTLYNTLSAAQDQLKQSATGGIFPGLEAGTKSAMRNLPVLNRLVGETARTLGSLARGFGRQLGSKAWGSDIADIGKQNTVVISRLGRAGFALAGGLRHVVHEAGPLTEWLAKAALHGAQLTEVWLYNARASGRMARFFREGRRDLTLLASATGHLTTGVFNLFGAQDVDGTKTLANLDRITAKFEVWTRTMVGKPLGPELEKQMGIALGRVAGFIGSHLGQAGQTAASAFWTAFKNAGIWGQGITAVWLANKFGLTKGVLGGLGRIVAGGAAGGGGAGGVVGKLAARGSSAANPLYVFDVAGGGAGGVAGKSRRGGSAVRGALGLAVPALPVAGAAWLTNKYGDKKTSSFSGTDPGASSGRRSRLKPGTSYIEKRMAKDAGDGGSYFPPVIIQIDGKTIATATARAGTKKKSTK